jgi:quercetin dioxygenase-like cupin family protein
MNKSYFKSALLLGCFALSMDSIADSSADIQRQVLLNKRVTLPGNSLETRVIRVTFAKGAKTPLHTHSGPGPRYVVNGSLRVVEGANDHVYSMGQVFWESGADMTVENVGGNQAEIIIFEMAPN